MSLDEGRLALVAERCAAVAEEIHRVFVGPREVSELLLVSLLARGHVLLEGVPGVAKTTLAKTFATSLGCDFRRIQFTPDLLPADITGTYVLTPQDGTFHLRKGPVFANIVLADEINRAPAKTQSALLEAMQESQTTIEGETFALPSPFIVIATQNPVEQAGTYPLPEAQIDRFLLRLVIGYPTPSDERAILRKLGVGSVPATAILSPAEILALQGMVEAVHVEDEILDYVVRMANHTRRNPQAVLGASPRASMALVQAAKARALCQGRAFVLPDDIKRLAMIAWAHRMVLTPEAQMEGQQGEALVRQALDQTALRTEPRS
jgi:MoxR-like ATPase